MKNINYMTFSKNVCKQRCPRSVQMQKTLSPDPVPGQSPAREEPFAPKPGGAFGPQYPLWARRRPGRVRMRRAFLIY